MALSSLNLQTECSAVGPISLRRALSYHVDLLSPLTRTGLQAFAAYCQVSHTHGSDCSKFRNHCSQQNRM